MDYVHTVSAAARQGRCSVTLDTIRTDSGDALLLTMSRVASSGPIKADTTTVLCRYLFGAPDGLQRALMECHVRKLGTIKAIFLLGHSAAHTGGLPGLRFALSDAGAATLVVVGPEGTTKLVESTQGFVTKHHPTVRCHDVVPSTSSELAFEDGLVEVLAVATVPETNRLERSIKTGNPSELDVARCPDSPKVCCDDPLECPGGHALVEYNTPCDGCWCSRCANTAAKDALFYGCRECDYDVCSQCMLTTKRQKTTSSPSRGNVGGAVHRCAQGHALVEYNTPCDGCWCSRCAAKVLKGTRLFGCRQCDYDLCSTCISKIEGSGGVKNIESSGGGNGRVDPKLCTDDFSNSSSSSEEESADCEDGDGAATRLFGAAAAVLGSAARMHRKNLTGELERGDAPVVKKRKLKSSAGSEQKIGIKSAASIQLGSSVARVSATTDQSLEYAVHAEASKLLATLQNEIESGARNNDNGTNGPPAAGAMSLCELERLDPSMFAHLIATARERVESALATTRDDSPPSSPATLSSGTTPQFLERKPGVGFVVRLSLPFIKQKGDHKDVAGGDGDGGGNNLVAFAILPSLCRSDTAAASQWLQTNTENLPPLVFHLIPRLESARWKVKGSVGGDDIFGGGNSSDGDNNHVNKIMNKSTTQTKHMCLSHGSVLSGYLSGARKKTALREKDSNTGLEESTRPIGMVPRTSTDEDLSATTTGSLVSIERKKKKWSSSSALVRAIASWAELHQIAPSLFPSLPSWLRINRNDRNDDGDDGDGPSISALGSGCDSRDVDGDHMIGGLVDTKANCVPAPRRLILLNQNGLTWNDALSSDDDDHDDDDKAIAMELKTTAMSTTAILAMASSNVTNGEVDDDDDDDDNSQHDSDSSDDGHDDHGEPNNSIRVEKQGGIGRCKKQAKKSKNNKCGGSGGGGGLVARAEANALRWLRTLEQQLTPREAVDLVQPSCQSATLEKESEGKEGGGSYLPTCETYAEGENGEKEAGAENTKEAEKIKKGEIVGSLPEGILSNNAAPACQGAQSTDSNQLAAQKLRHLLVSHQVAPGVQLPSPDQTHSGHGGGGSIGGTAASNLVRHNNTQQQQCQHRRALHMVMLGSGCAKPSPRRNCTGILLYITTTTTMATAAASQEDNDEGGEEVVWSFLMDCGEGILGQIEAHFGESVGEKQKTTKMKNKKRMRGGGGGGADDDEAAGVGSSLPSPPLPCSPAVSASSILRTLRGVWVSHRHADHHSGLPALLERVVELQSQQCRASVASAPPGRQQLDEEAHTAIRRQEIVSSQPPPPPHGNHHRFLDHRDRHRQGAPQSRYPLPTPPLPPRSYHYDQPRHPPPRQPPLPPGPPPPLKQNRHKRHSSAAAAAAAVRPFVVIACTEVITHVKLQHRLSCGVSESTGTQSRQIAEEDDDDDDDDDDCEVVRRSGIRLVMATPQEANWPENEAHAALVNDHQRGSGIGGGSSRSGGNSSGGGVGGIGGPLLSFASVPVLHCKNSFGLVLTFKREAVVATSHQQQQQQQQQQQLPQQQQQQQQPSQELSQSLARPSFQLVYSGDTRPCALLCANGKGCDVLVHEATFDDDRLQDARRKRHSTVGEATKAARDMRTKGLLVLTHFSQRYKVGASSSSSVSAATKKEMSDLPPPPTSNDVSSSSSGSEQREQAEKVAVAGGATKESKDSSSSTLSPAAPSSLRVGIRTNGGLAPLVRISAYDHLELRDLAALSSAAEAERRVVLPEMEEQEEDEAGSGSACVPQLRSPQKGPRHFAALFEPASTPLDQLKRELGLIDKYFGKPDTPAASSESVEVGLSR